MITVSVKSVTVDVINGVLSAMCKCISRYKIDSRELEYQLKNFVKQFGENGLNALAEIHPDRKLLELNCESCKGNSNFSNANGNGREHLAEMPSRFHNANGEDQIRKEQITLSQALIFGGMALVGVAIIMRK